MNEYPYQRRRFNFDTSITLGSVVNLVLTLCGVIYPLLVTLHHMDNRQALADQEIAELESRVQAVEVGNERNKDTTAEQYRVLTVSLAQVQAQLSSLAAKAEQK